MKIFDISSYSKNQLVAFELLNGTMAEQNTE